MINSYFRTSVIRSYASNELTQKNNQEKMSNINHKKYKLIALLLARATFRLLKETFIELLNKNKIKMQSFNSIKRLS
jgi:hypothetical protein